MKIFFKASLLAILFVGMSSFSENKVEEADRDCVAEATFAYRFYQSRFPWASESALLNIYYLVEAACADEWVNEDENESLNDKK